MILKATRKEVMMLLKWEQILVFGAHFKANGVEHMSFWRDNDITKDYKQIKNSPLSVCVCIERKD